MKHAGAAALDTIESMLVAARAVVGLTERSRGIFYRRAIAFLHFHEDPAGMFADLKFANGWRRSRVSTASERRRFLAALRAAAESFDVR